MKKKWVYTYQKGNISLFDEITFTDFEKDMVMEVVKWNDGNRSFYQFVKDKKEIKDLLKLFDNTEKLGDYMGDLPENEEGVKYNVIFRQLEEL